VVIIDLTGEMVALNVISQPTNAIVKFSTITKIHKYRKFFEKATIYYNGHGGAQRT
jgi:hypothetical protein